MRKIVGLFPDPVIAVFLGRWDSESRIHGDNEADQIKTELYAFGKITAWCFLIGLSLVRSRFLLWRIQTAETF
jgi:hypothetical protein